MNSYKDQLKIISHTYILRHSCYYILKLLLVTIRRNTVILKYYYCVIKTFTCLSFLSNGSQILTPQKIKLIPYFISEERM